MERFNEIPPTIKMIKEELLREFPKERHEDLDLERAEEFIRSEGLAVKPYVIFYREELSKAKAITEKSRLFRKGLDNGESGLYSPEADLGVVVRDRDYEELNGPIFSEGIAVHELAHASSMFQSYVTEDYVSAHTPRVGFCLPQNKTPWGWMMEEGWADMHRANYIAKYASREERQKVEVLLSFGRVEMEDTAPVRLHFREVLPIPLKYVYIGREGKLSAKASSYAAYALEILCKNNPELKPLLVEARYSNEGLRKMSKALGSIMPDLYKEFHTRPYTEEDCYDMLSKIISRAEGGMENLIRASGPMREEWNRILKKS